MSFLGARSQTPSGSINMDKIDMALTELDTITDFFSRMVQSCHAKCISTRYAEADLNKGESVCVDRCVAKFTDVQKKVMERLQAKQQQGGAGQSTGIF
ncbi:Tim10/DDP family zinc finger-domain-containing protein [Cyathus striatus]|nr:Tim10/DDP family zinc finger-domain-containing protein [Cyathus striatus]